MSETHRATITRLRARPLSVPLRAPFVIATARMDATRAALVEVEVARADGATARGLGEAAALPPVTHEDQPALLAMLADASARLSGLALEGPRHGTGVDRTAALASSVGPALDAALGASSVARAAVEAALVDALGRLDGTSARAWLGGPAVGPDTLVTDITLSIAGPDAMVEAARPWRAAGFDCFKVKVGHAWRRDRDALVAVHQALPGSRFRLDANEGFTAPEALALLDDVRAAGLVVECFEQPCRRDAPAEMVEVTRAAGVPVVADESLRSMADLEAILRTRAAHGVNLKLVKLGGPLAALEIGRRARAEGLGVMAGAMVETRLGLSAMAHVVSALGGVDWVDLDTHLLLAADPFMGGLASEGPRLSLGDGVGYGLDLRDADA